MGSLFKGSLFKLEYTRGLSLALLALWTCVLGVSLFLFLRSNRITTREIAVQQANMAYQWEVIYRDWNAMNGGVYAPVTGHTQPNPHLEVPERDLTTPSGRSLTLVNPAYMTRQVNEMAEERYGKFGHITSLNPIRPANAPDPWEERALQRFEEGEQAVASTEMYKGAMHLRYMRPLVTTESCLKCHASQGYEVGEIRGGISVAVPLAPLLVVQSKEDRLAVLSHLGIWLVGLLGILLGVRHLRRRLEERNRALLASQRLKTANRMAATIAHEFNTPLAVIQMATELACKNGEKPEDARRDYLDRIPHQVGKMQDLVRRLLSLRELHEKTYVGDVSIFDLQSEMKDENGVTSGQEAQQAT